MIQALAEQNGELVVPHGASSANVLGLTQQVPIRKVYLTFGNEALLVLQQALK